MLCDLLIGLTVIHASVLYLCAHDCLLGVGLRWSCFVLKANIPTAVRTDYRPSRVVSQTEGPTSGPDRMKALRGGTYMPMARRAVQID